MGWPPPRTPNFNVAHRLGGAGASEKTLIPAPRPGRTTTATLKWGVRGGEPLPGSNVYVSVFFARTGSVLRWNFPDGPCTYVCKHTTAPMGGVGARRGREGRGGVMVVMAIGQELPPNLP